NVCWRGARVDRLTHARSHRRRFVTLRGKPTKAWRCWLLRLRRPRRGVAVRTQGQRSGLITHESVSEAHNRLCRTIVTFEPYLTRVRILGAETEQVRAGCTGKGINRLARVADNTQVVA